MSNGNLLFGPSSSEPCQVCGEHKNNQWEPRFGYTVCIEHQNVAPVDIPEKPPERK